jgi:hypothetical protein
MCTIAEMISVVNTQYQMFDRAYKSLKNIAINLSSGTAKDKEANAESVVNSFYVGAAVTRGLLDNLQTYKEVVEFGSMNLNRILKQREDQAAVNPTYDKEGTYLGFQKRMMREDPGVPDDIPTRKKIKRW